MAKYIPIGEPANHSEADSIRALRDQLPEHYTVIGNFELQLPNRSNTFEYDAVVIGEHGLYAVEVKGWSGEIRGDIRRWFLDWGRVANPLILTERKAKALRSFVCDNVSDLPREVFCQSVVLLPPTANVCVEDPRAKRILTTERLYDFFVDEDVIREHGPGHLLGGQLREEIERVLLPFAAPASHTPRIADYEIIGEYDQQDHLPYREFVGRHRLLRTRSQVRIKRYTLDPLANAGQRQRQYERALRDMEALTQLGGNPYIAAAYELIRDQEDELNFYLVSEWVGPTSLAEFIAERADGDQKKQIDVRPLAAHLLRAVKFMHERGIVHRNLHPGVIYMTPDGASVPLKITDFDYARVVQLPSIEGSLEQMGTEGYAAPELWQRDDCDYDHRIDLFSVGAILFELLTGQKLYSSVADMLRHDATWERQRALLQDDAIRDLLDNLLIANPDERLSELSEAIERVET